MRQERADQVLEIVRRSGINHLDTAASYGDSELRLAPFLAAHRADYFLATKTDERTGDGARAQLELSLTRLGVDSVDLIQLHNLVEPDEFEVAHGPGGAVAALRRARDEGLVRHIGVTGHGLRIIERHLMSLERFDFASVLFPYNHVLLRDPTYRASVDQLLDVCAQRGVAVQTIKSIARRRWTPESTAPKYSWYEPLPPSAALAHAVQFVLANPQVFLNTSSDATLLEATLDAAQGEPTAPTEQELAADADALDMAPLFDGGPLERI
ncbi:MAG: putative aldo-keto reductase [Acidimicrobiales bacterium]|nr:putative aldo-keto reductase [Acidimicrobiales bacterium]